MTPQERDLLQGLLDRLAQSPAGAIDAEADALIKRSLGDRADATYRLVQQNLIQHLALQQAHQQLGQLQQELRTAKASGGGAVSSFLGGPAAGAPAQAPRTAGSGFSNFLQSAATTAAGVAGGALLFDGIQHLFGAHSAVGGFGGVSGQPVEYVENNTVINEYAGNDSDGGSLDNGDGGYADDDYSYDGGDDGSWI